VRDRRLFSALAALALLAAGPARAQKPGSIGFGASLGIGYEVAQTPSSGIAANQVDLSRFSYGPSFAVRFRYKLAGANGLGFGFEAQEFQFDGVRGPEDPKKLHLDIVSVEWIRYFSTAEPRRRYILGGVTLVPKVEARLDIGESQFEPNQGFGLVLGGGTEMLHGKRANGIDLSLRVYPFVVDGRYATSAVLALGFNHYMQP
jgi:hypothetical protein